MGTFYSKDGPITTEKDYDVVKRVPEGQVVYNPKFPTLVYYENQVLPMKNGVIVNHEGSDWIMEPYENYARKYNLNRQNNQNTQTPNVPQREAQINPEKIKELITKLREQKNLEPLLSSHRELPDPDLKEIEEKYGIYISSKGEFLLKDGVKFNQFKNLATLILKYAYFLKTGDEEVFKKNLTLKQLSIYVDINEIDRIGEMFFKGTVASSLIKHRYIFAGHLLRLFYDPDATFSSLDAEFAKILFNKAENYYKDNNDSYFTFSVKSVELPSDYEYQEFVLTWAPLFLSHIFKSDFSINVQTVMSIPSAILGPFAFDLIEAKKQDLFEIIKDLFDIRRLNNFSFALSDTYLNSGLDLGETLLVAHEMLTEKFRESLKRDMMFDDIQDEDFKIRREDRLEEEPAFRVLSAVGSFYIGVLLTSLFSNENFKNQLENQDVNNLATFFIKTFSNFAQSSEASYLYDMMFLRYANSYGEKQAAIKVLISKIIKENLEERENIKNHLSKVFGKEEDKENGEENIENLSFNNYLSDIESTFEYLFQNPFDKLTQIQDTIKQILQKRNPSIDPDTFLYFIPFILENLNNPVIAYGINKELLEEVLNVIFSELEDLSKTTGYKPWNGHIRKQVKYLLQRIDDSYDNNVIRNLSKSIIELITSSNESNVYENAKKINQILDSALKKLNDLREAIDRGEITTEELDTFIKYSEFLSETIKMFEDLFHPQNTADLILLEMKQGLDLLSIKKNLYETFVAIEKHDFSLAQALKESLLHRRDNFLFTSPRLLKLLDNYEEIKAQENYTNFKSNNINSALSYVLEIIDHIKDLNFASYEGKTGSMLNDFKNELLVHLNYIANYLTQGYKSDPIFKLNFSLYKSLEVLDLMYTYSSNQRVREFIKNVGSRILRSKYLLSDVLMESKYDTSVVAPVSSGSSSSLISGHIYFMNLMKDLNKYNEFAKKLAERQFKLMTVARLAQTRDSMFSIRLGKDNKLIIHLPIRADYPFMLEGDARTPSRAVMETFHGTNVFLEKHNLKRMYRSYGRFSFPKHIQIREQPFYFDNLREIIFSKEKKSIDSMSNIEYIISNVPLTVSHEKFLGANKPISDIMLTRSNGISLRRGAIQRSFNYVKKQVSHAVDNIFNLEKDSLDSEEKIEEYKEKVDKYFESVLGDTFSEEAFDNLVDTEEVLDKITKRTIKSEVKKDYSYRIEITTLDETGKERKFFIFPSSISLESFRRISYKFLHTLLTEYAEEKRRYLSKDSSDEEKNFAESKIKVLGQQINEFKKLIESLDENDFTQTTGVLKGIFKELIKPSVVRGRFIPFLAKQLLLEASLGINATYVVDEDGIGMAPFIESTNELNDNLEHYSYPVYRNKSNSPRFMYKTFKLLGKYSERTIKNKEIVEAAKRISRTGDIRYLSGFYRAYGGHTITMDVYDDLFSSHVFQKVLAKRNISLFDFIEELLDSGILEEFDRFYAKLSETRFYTGLSEATFNPYELRLAGRIASRFSSLVGEYFDVDDVMDFLYKLNRGMKTTLYHELGHYVDYINDPDTRKNVYDNIRRSIHQSLQFLITKIEENKELNQNIKERLIGLIKTYISDYLTNPNLTNLSSNLKYNYYDQYLNLLKSLKDMHNNKNLEILAQIFQEAHERGYLLDSYALFVPAEVPSTVLEFLSSMKKDEFIRRFPIYAQYISYLYDTMKERGYLS